MLLKVAYSPSTPFLIHSKKEKRGPGGSHGQLWTVTIFVKSGKCGNRTPEKSRRVERASFLFAKRV